MSRVGAILVLDTSGWLSYYGLGSPAKVRVVRIVVDQFRALGFGLGYTSPTLYEVRKSPRPEIRSRRADILRHMRSLGVLVGPSYGRLIDLVSFVPEAYRHDAAIALAAGPHVLLTLDSWQAMFRLAAGGKTIYLDARILSKGGRE